MPTNKPTGFETYIYDFRAFPGSLQDDRPFQGPLHDPTNLPSPTCSEDTSPFIMVEPSGESGSTDVWIRFHGSDSFMLPRKIAEQLRDALIKVCEKK